MDRWIVGEGADSPVSYVVHLSEPLFVAKYAVDGDQPVKANVLYADDGWVFWDFVWLGGQEPNKKEFHALMAAAVDAIARQPLR